MAFDFNPFWQCVDQPGIGDSLIMCPECYQIIVLCIAGIGSFAVCLSRLLLQYVMVISCHFWRAEITRFTSAATLYLFCGSLFSVQHARNCDEWTIVISQDTPTCPTVWYRPRPHNYRMCDSALTFNGLWATTLTHCVTVPLSFSQTLNKYMYMCVA